jgi:hypothetical protein
MEIRTAQQLLDRVSVVNTYLTTKQFRRQHTED